MNQLMAASGSGTSGVDWGQVTKIGQTLLESPLVGFSAAWLLLTPTQIGDQNTGAVQGA